MDQIQELQNQLGQALDRLEKVEAKTNGIQPTALLNQVSVDPSSVKFLTDFIALPYSDAFTNGTPTITPRKYGSQYLTKDTATGNFYLFIYTPGGWKRSQIT